MRYNPKIVGMCKSGFVVGIVLLVVAVVLGALMGFDSIAFQGLLTLGAIAMSLALGVFNIYTLILVLTARNDTTWKLIWFLVVWFIGVIGAVIYFYMAHKERKE